MIPSNKRSIRHSNIGPKHSLTESHHIYQHSQLPHSPMVVSLKILLLILFTIIGINISYSQGFKTQSISVFKNGLAFIQKSAQVKVKDQQAILYDLGTTSDSTLNLKDELKALKFGSLWFRSPNQDLHSVSRYSSQVDNYLPIQNLRELLTSNPGQPATFFFKDTHAAIDPAIRKDPVKVLADTWTLTGDFLMLSSGGKWSNAHLSDLEGVEFLSKPKLKRKTQEEKLGLHLQFNSSKSRQDVEMMYVRKGIYWVPTYHLDIVSANEARLRLVANLLNDVEDIEDCSMNFVVGVPNFEFKDIATPLGNDATVEQFMQELAGQRLATATAVNPHFNLNSAAFSNAVSYNYSSRDNTSSTQTTQRFIVEPESDLEDGMFLYPKENISLRKGGRALIDLFEENVPLEKVYHCELPPNSINSLNQSATRRDVIQSFKISNRTGRPLTHGPVFVTSSQGESIRPIANDKILFTPSGMNAYIKAADANDILLYDEEKESTGNIQALTGWKKLTMDAGFSITNMREEPIVIEVTRLIHGEPKRASSDDWEEEIVRKKLRKQNQISRLKWRIELKAQQTKKIDYKYTVNN